MKQQGLPEGIPVCNLQQRTAYCHNHAGYHKGRSTYHSTKRINATPVHIQPQAPVSPSGFVELTQALWGDEPMKSDPPPVITGIMSKEIIDPYKVMGTAMMAIWLLQHHTTREVLINIQFCSEATVGLGLETMVVDYPALMLWELSDSDN